MDATRGTRLRQARLNAGYEDIREVAPLVGVSFGQLAKYERDEVFRIKKNTLDKLAALYHTTPEYIETGIRTGKESFNTMPTRIIITNNQQRAQTLLVPHKAEAGYRKSFSDQEYLGTLPTYAIPGFEHGNYRMFEVAGVSMVPTFEPGDILICEFVERPEEIVDGTIYVIVTTDGICVKRVTNAVAKRGYLIIESDNPEYKPDLIQPSEVLEMWSYRKKLTI